MSESITGAASHERPTRPVAPVRTRWLESRAVEAGDAILPPAHSAAPPFRRPIVRPAAPVPYQAETPETGSESAEFDPMPWDGARRPAVEPIVLSADLTAGVEGSAGADAEPWGDVEAGALLDLPEGDIELEPAANVGLDLNIEDLELLPEDEPELLLEEIGLETRFLEPLPEGVIPVRAPLSPWDISETEDDSSPDEPTSRAARARAEWEALGEALAASIGGEDASVFESAMQALAEGIAATEAIEEGAGVTREIVDIADRIAWFAARLRSEGYRAITNAQARGDRLDIALAGLAAGFLAGQTE
jgi:hypothetical protein